MKVRELIRILVERDMDEKVYIYDRSNNETRNVGVYCSVEGNNEKAFILLPCGKKEDNKEQEKDKQEA